MSDFQTRFILAQELLTLTAADRSLQEAEMHKIAAPLLSLKQVREVLDYTRSITPQIFSEMYTVEELKALIEFQTKFPQLAAKQMAVMGRCAEMAQARFEQVVQLQQMPSSNTFDC